MAVTIAAHRSAGMTTKELFARRCCAGGLPAARGAAYAAAMKLRLPVVLCSMLAFAACGEDEGGSSGSAGSGAGSTSSGSAICSGAMAVLQKDAYRETAGRTHGPWPPHTTTQLSWSCSDSDVTTTAFQANHGTEPGETDANGDVLLVETGAIQVSGSPAQMLALQEAYDACVCNTKFLSLDALGDEAVQELVSLLSDYIIANVDCTGNVSSMELAGLLQMGDVEAVVAEINNCSWNTGGWSGGFDDALTAVLEQAMETLDEYHVCNNDAQIQVALVSTYANTGDVVPCDGDAPACHGPQWLYTP